ncbi:hypothetical protein TNCV_2819331 [Trichonephila clavipes]|nr:hypothetical protein TNCV_2819331 [Trichonephila clavipes]
MLIRISDTNLGPFPGDDLSIKRMTNHWISQVILFDCQYPLKIPERSRTRKSTLLKFSSPVKAQSNVLKAEDTTKNIVTAKIDTPESTCNFMAENIYKLKVIKVKCLDVVLDETVDSGAQMSVVRAERH